ncbi:MAG: TIM barrel protein [Spirochaetaceae bacterium]
MPKLYLAIDNCFATKRWTRPLEWARKVRELGLTYVEASADTENDPLYHGAAYQERWLEEVEAACRTTGVRVANLYSGHGTYSTLGLGHTDADVARRLLEEWLEPQVRAAARLGAGLGFFAHAFSISTLADPEVYKAARDALVSRLAELARYAQSRLSAPIGVEQMYAPHQIPWTLEGTRELLSDIHTAAGAPMYTNVDVGHQSGQSRFPRPTFESFEKSVALLRDESEERLPWLGVEEAYTLAEAVATGGERIETAWERVDAMAAERPYLFAKPEDGDPYRWLSAFGPYSPIVHLQQTDGESSPHAPFTPTWNAKGVITGERVLTALAKGYEEPFMPESVPPVEELYLTIEVFLSTASNPFSSFRELRRTVEYWRRFVPEDGMELREAVDRLGKEMIHG